MVRKPEAVQRDVSSSGSILNKVPSNLAGVRDSWPLVLSSVKLFQTKRRLPRTGGMERNARNSREKRKRVGKRANTLGEDAIVKYRPLPVFVSDQIGGWLVVVSLEYILIPGDPSRGTFAE